MPTTPSVRATTLRSAVTGPLLPESASHRRATAAAAAAGLAAVGWVVLSPATRELEGVVRATVALPAFALGFGAVMLVLAVASDLRPRR